jgi:hypothetical protein
MVVALLLQMQQLRVDHPCLVCLPAVASSSSSSLASQAGTLSRVLLLGLYEQYRQLVECLLCIWQALAVQQQQELQALVERYLAIDQVA